MGATLSLQQQQMLIQQGILLGQQLAAQQMQQQQFPPLQQQWAINTVPPPTPPQAHVAHQAIPQFGTIGDISDPYGLFQQGFAQQQQPLQSQSAQQPVVSMPYPQWDAGGAASGIGARHAWQTGVSASDPAGMLLQQQLQPQQPGAWQGGARTVVPEGCSVFVGNFPPYWDEFALVERFQGFGSIVSASIVKDKATGMAKGFAFVNYSDPVAANAAAAAMMGLQVDGNHRLQVNIKHSKPRAAPY